MENTQEQGNQEEVVKDDQEDIGVDQEETPLSNRAVSKDENSDVKSKLVDILKGSKNDQADEQITNGIAGDQTKQIQSFPKDHLTNSDEQSDVAGEGISHLDKFVSDIKLRLSRLKLQRERADKYCNKIDRGGFDKNAEDYAPIAFKENGLSGKKADLQDVLNEFDNELNEMAISLDYISEFI